MFNPQRFEVGDKVRVVDFSLPINRPRVGRTMDLLRERRAIMTVEWVNKEGNLYCKPEGSLSWYYHPLDLEKVEEEM